MKKYVLILGALSDIAKSTAFKFAENGYDLLLAARKLSELEIEYKDLKLKYNIDVNFYEFDVLKSNTHQSFIENLKEIPSIVICAIGYPPKHRTSSLKLNQWRYWKHRFGTFVVMFETDKVTKVVGLDK